MIGRMAATSNEVSTKILLGTKGKPHSVGRRREWPEALKRQMVAETLEPGASVSIVARRHDVNTNQLFKWRRELLPKALPAVVAASTMVPVAIVAEQPRRRRPRSQGHHRDRVRQRRVGKPARRGGAGGSPPGDRAAAMIGLAPGTRVWLAAGVTDMCKGFEPQCSGRLVGDRMIRHEGGIRRPDFRDLLPQGMSRPAGARRKVEKPVLLSVRQRCHLSVIAQSSDFPAGGKFRSASKPI